MTEPARPEDDPGVTPQQDPVRAEAPHRPTRVSAAWVATGIGLVLLILLLVFILQNLQRAPVHFLWFDGSMPIGIALFGASVVGGVVVAVAGVSRVVQLRRSNRRLKRAAS